MTSRGDRVQVVVTDLGILEPRGNQLVLTHVHPGSTVEAALAATGWSLEVADDVSVTEPPSELELHALRSLETAGQG